MGHVAASKFEKNKTGKDLKTPEWAKKQINIETKNGGQSLSKEVVNTGLSKKKIISILKERDAGGDAKGWNKNRSTPKNSARYVLAIEAAMLLAGHYTGKIDGIWGPEIKKALGNFQIQSRLAKKTDSNKKWFGAPGPKTIGALVGFLEGKNFEIVDNEDKKTIDDLSVKITGIIGELSDTGASAIDSIERNFKQIIANQNLDSGQKTKALQDIENRLIQQKTSIEQNYIIEENVAKEVPQSGINQNIIVEKASQPKINQSIQGIILRWKNTEGFAKAASGAEQALLALQKSNKLLGDREQLKNLTQFRDKLLESEDEIGQGGEVEKTLVRAIRKVSGLATFTPVGVVTGLVHSVLGTENANAQEQAIEGAKFIASIIPIAGNLVDISEGIYGFMTGKRMGTDIPQSTNDALFSLGIGLGGTLIDLVTLGVAGAPFKAAFKAGWKGQKGFRKIPGILWNEGKDYVTKAAKGIISDPVKSLKNGAQWLGNTFVANPLKFVAKSVKFSTITAPMAVLAKGFQVIKNPIESGKSAWKAISNPKETLTGAWTGIKTLFKGNQSEKKTNESIKEISASNLLALRDLRVRRLDLQSQIENVPPGSLRIGLQKEVSKIDANIAHLENSSHNVINSNPDTNFELNKKLKKNNKKIKRLEKENADLEKTQLSNTSVKEFNKMKVAKKKGSLSKEGLKNYEKLEAEIQNMQKNQELITHNSHEIAALRHRNRFIEGRIKNPDASLIESKPTNKDHQSVENKPHSTPSYSLDKKSNIFLRFSSKAQSWLSRVFQKKKISLEDQSQWIKDLKNNPRKKEELVQEVEKRVKVIEQAQKKGIENKNPKKQKEV